LKFLFLFFPFLVTLFFSFLYLVRCSGERESTRRRRWSGGASRPQTAIDPIWTFVFTFVFMLMSRLMRVRILTPHSNLNCIVVPSWLIKHRDSLTHHKARGTYNEGSGAECVRISAGGATGGIWRRGSRPCTPPCASASAQTEAGSVCTRTAARRSALCRC
jgi:hypothetical protein